MKSVRAISLFIVIACLSVGAARLHAADEIWAWGLNSNGQLGDGTDTARIEPVRTHILTDVSAIAGGGFHSLAIQSDSTVWAWGRNDCGQLGIGNTIDRWEPVQTHILTDVDAISTRGYHSFALKKDVGIKEEKGTLKENKHGGTIFSGPLLPLDNRECKVFDITGRVLAPQKMRPGVYFIEINNEIVQKIVKIR